MLGHGGIKAVAEAAGVSSVTVSKGVAELESGEAPLGRTRRRGGGRKALTVVDPGLFDALLRGCVEPQEPGRSGVAVAGGRRSPPGRWPRS